MPAVFTSDQDTRFKTTSEQCTNWIYFTNVTSWLKRERERWKTRTANLKITSIQFCYNFHMVHLCKEKFNDMQWNESDSEIAVQRKTHVPIIIYSAQATIAQMLLNGNYSFAEEWEDERIGKAIWNEMKCHLCAISLSLHSFMRCTSLFLYRWHRTRAVTCRNLCTEYRVGSGISSHNRLRININAHTLYAWMICWTFNASHIFISPFIHGTNEHWTAMHEQCAQKFIHSCFFSAAAFCDLWIAI